MTALFGWVRSKDALGFERTSPDGRHWWNVVFRNDWREWMPGGRERFNWRNFHVVNLHFEDDHWTAGWEFDVALLGFGFHLRYTDQVAFSATTVGSRAEEAMEHWDATVAIEDAAPELLAALEHALDWLEFNGCGCGEDGEDECSLCHARAAIAKARPEPTTPRSAVPDPRDPKSTP